MILIIGQTEDDILYFRSRFTSGESKERNSDGVNVYRGNFGAEPIAVAAIGDGNLLTAMRTAALIEKYDPYLVINIGSITSISDSLHVGDLYMADRYYLRGVDFSYMGQCAYGQYPGQGTYFLFNAETANNVRDLSYGVTSRYIGRGYLLSGEKIIYTTEQAAKVIRTHYASISRLMNAYDTASGGIALACSNRAVSLLTIRVVGSEAGKPETFLTAARTTLSAMPEIGAIIAQFLIAKQNQFMDMLEDAE